jgi:hypothetical protein
LARDGFRSAIVGLLMVWAWGTMAVPAVAQSDTIDQQRFEVYVPPRLSGLVNVEGPPSVRIVHDGTDNNQAFAPQHWDIGSNARRGAQLSLTTLTAFRRNGSVLGVRRDARLNLALLRADSGSNWAVTTPTAQTNYRAGVLGEIATVRAESFGAGDATFDLRVQFITEDSATLPQGDYLLTVVGTISAK